MSWPTRVIAMLAMPLALSACDSNQQTDHVMDDMAIAVTTPQRSDPMSAGTAHGTGVVTAIDNDSGTVTIDHGPVPSLDWPAMAMGFAAAKELRASVVNGDRVSFSFRQTGDGYELLTLTKK